MPLNSAIPMSFQMPDFSRMVPDYAGAAQNALAIQTGQQERARNAMLLDQARQEMETEAAWRKAIGADYKTPDARIDALRQVDPERAETFAAGLMRTEEGRASAESRRREIARTGLQGILENARTPEDAAEGWKHFQTFYPQTDLSRYAPREWTPESIQMQMGMLGATTEGDAFTLSPGQVRFNAAGRPVAQVETSASPQAAASIQEYNLWASQQPPGADRGYERFLKVTTEATTRPQSGAGQYTLQDIRNLNNDWQEALQPVRDLERQSDLMEVGIEQARQGNMTAGSQAVLVTFQKILDPTSVVRESEYARSASGLALLDQIQGGIERLQQGGAGVPLQQLEQFYRLAREAVNKLNTGYVESERQRIEGVADAYEIPKHLIFEGDAPADDLGFIPD